MPPEKRWEVFPLLTPESKQELGEYSPVLRQILYNRGYTTKATAQEFLAAQSPSGTEPEKMLGIPAAVERLDYALTHSEAIAIYGDYDADGVTATALLVQFLKQLGADVQGYIPNRFDEGYGLNIEALDSLKEKGVGLVITVDCGIRSPLEAEHARQIGLDLIITDHHHPLGDVPDCLAVINPKQPGDTYPDKDLAGVGLAYKLAVGYLNYPGKKYILPNSITPVENFLDLVALGTISDLAPLRGENRALVKKGLEIIRQPRRQGLFSLIKVSGLTAQNIGASEISFALGPRLNAAGRLESALAALNLLISTDLNEAGELAQKLENQNRDRQEKTREALALAEILAHPEQDGQYILIAADPGFSSGIVGLVASRLTEAYYRPSIVAYQGPEFTRASCRSIPDFHITDALDECVDLMEHHGGHAAAAGFTIRNERWMELKDRLQNMAEQQLSVLDLRPSIKADIALPLVDLKPEILTDIERLQPTGNGNPQPIFCSRGLKVNRFRAVGKDNAHLKVTLSDNRITYDAIGFRLGSWAEKMPPSVDIMYYFERNEYNGNTSLQLNLRDLKPA
jgi:single-stranded-DNA-specific exonuclease